MDGPMMRNLTLTGGVTPARANMRTVSLEEVPDGYRAMADHQALLVLIRP
jgi:hypothetical protein